MLGRSTPSPERAPDGPLSLNGSIKSAGTAVAKLLHDQTAESGTPAGNRKAPDSTPTPTPGLGAPLTSPPRVNGEVEQVASQSAASPNGTSEPKESSTEGTLAAGAGDEPLPSGTGPEGSDEQGKPDAGVRAPLVAGGRVLVRWRGLRSTVFGVALVVLAAALGFSSALSVALLVAGVLMLIVGLVGPRLQGRFALEFGPHGASIEIQTHLAPPGRTRIAGPLAPWKPTGALTASRREDAGPPPAHDPTTDAALPDAVIDAGGDTIVDVER